MAFTDIFIKRPVLATVVSFVILLFGLRALTELPLRQFPEMKNTVITVSTYYSGASPDLMQGYVTSRVEKAISTAEGIEYLTSSSSASSSKVTAHIKLNFDPNIAMTDIMAKVAQIQNELPKDSDKPVIQKTTGSEFAVMYIGYNSDHLNNQQLTDYLTRVIQPKLQSVAGVSSAELFGGQTYAMRIWLDSEKLASLHLTTEDVTNALLDQNYQTAGGQIKGKYVAFTINAHTDISKVAQFENITVKQGKNVLIRIKDIARVELGADSYDSSVIFNGKTAVFFGINVTPTANPLVVINDIKKLLPELTESYPPGVSGKIVYDSTEYIRSSIHEVMTSIAEACLIVIAVVFLFLGSMRIVTIPVVTIPLSLIGVCTLMYTMNYSINLLTLLAMVLAIGLVVDDAIVVVENIYRHIEEGYSPKEASLLGAKEIALPIVAMTLTLAAVYAPIGFLTGITGALFKEFAFTLAFTVIISGIIALTLSPMMCSKILNADIGKEGLVHKIDLFFEDLKARYECRLRHILDEPRVVSVFVIIMLCAAFGLAKTTAKELAPTEDQSVVFMQALAPAYANIDYLEKYTKELNGIFRSHPEMQDFFIINGAGAPTSAFGGMILKPWGKRKLSQNALIGRLQPEVSKIAGLNTFVFPLPSIPGAGGGLSVEFVLTSTEDFIVLNQVVEKMLAEAMKSGYFMFMDTDLKFEKPELQIDIDRDKAALMGIKMSDISRTLSTLLGGGGINRFSDAGQSYEVIPEVPREFRMNPHQIDNYYVPAMNKQLVPLSSIVSMHIEVKPGSLNHFQQLNSATIQAMPMPGKTIVECLNYLHGLAKTMAPIGVSFDFSGESRQAMQEGNAMVYTFFFALLVIFLVLAAQFESFKDPLIVLVSVPLSITGALIPLQLGFATLNIYTGIGLVTLIGLISKHGILIVDFANKLRVKDNLNVRDAVVKAATLRLRPILMTTAAMVLGVFPLLIATGAGAVSRENIGLVISSGMLIGTCFTLFVVPSVYCLLKKND